MQGLYLGLAGPLILQAALESLVPVDPEKLREVIELGVLKGKAFMGVAREAWP